MYTALHTCAELALIYIFYQVFSKATEEDANGWWEASIKMIKGDFYVVAYKNTDTTINEIVQKERLRVPNNK